MARGEIIPRALFFARARYRGSVGTQKLSIQFKDEIRWLVRAE
jgi:hypothetical protein